MATIKNKKSLFLTNDNAFKVAKRVYAHQIKNGGNKKFEDIFKIIPHSMASWHKVDKLDSYESLVFNNLEDEIQQINEEFIEEYVGSSHNSTIILNTSKFTANDYGLLDSDQQKPLSFGRQKDIAFDRISRHNRLYAESDFETKSTESISSLRYDMDAVLEEANKPNNSIDYLDTPYYGQNSYIEIGSTNWSS